MRPYSHALSDDDKLYRSAAEREADALRDPLAKMQMRLLREGILTAEEITALEQSLEQEVAEAAETRPSRSAARGRGITRHVYSEDLDPTNSAFATETCRRVVSSVGADKSSPGAKARPRTMADLINACLHDEMRRDPRIVVFGEDVADASREAGSGRGQRQGRRLQAHRRPANRVRLRARLQLAAGRGQHRRPRRRVTQYAA